MESRGGGIFSNSQQKTLEFTSVMSLLKSIPLTINLLLHNTAPGTELNDISKELKKYTKPNPEMIILGVNISDFLEDIKIYIDSIDRNLPITKHKHLKAEHEQLKAEHEQLKAEHEQLALSESSKEKKGGKKKKSKKHKKKRNHKTKKYKK